VTGRVPGGLHRAAQPAHPAVGGASSMTTQDIYFCIQTGLQFLVGGGIDTVDAPAMIDRW
jgi:hypothetical protein